MRTASIVLSIALLLGAAPRAAAEDWQEVTFEAPVPGTVLTPYWLADYLCIGCNPAGELRRTLADTPWGDRPLHNPRALMEICDKPFPPGSFDEETLGVPPSGTRAIRYEIYPTVDWDIALCEFRGPASWELRADPDDIAERWRLVRGHCACVPPPCNNELGNAVPIGCADQYTNSVSEDLPYKLVAYNWSDVLPAPGRWTWI